MLIFFSDNILYFTFLKLGDVPCRSQSGSGLPDPDLLTMKEIRMKKSDKSLLPLRGKISPPTILNCESLATEQKDDNKEPTKRVFGRERLFSASTISASSSKNGSSLSERCLTPPFTPPAPANGDHGSLFRRPSEHFLEVLGEHKQTPTLPKVFSASCLPPLRQAFQGDDSSRRILRGTKIVLSGNHQDENALSRQVESNGGPLLLVSEESRELSAPNLVSKRVLRKSQSLPLIKTCSALTTGIDYLNISGFQNHRPSVILSEEQKIDTYDRANNSPIEENLEEICADEDEELDEDDEEQTLGKFSMICHWLKDCEKAKVS